MNVGYFMKILIVRMICLYIQRKMRIFDHQIYLHLCMRLDLLCPIRIINRRHGMSWRRRTWKKDGWINWWEWMPERISLEHEGRNMLTYLVHLHHWWGNHNNHHLISQLLGIIIVQRSWKSPYEISQCKIILMLWSVSSLMQHEEQTVIWRCRVSTALG